MSPYNAYSSSLSSSRLSSYTPSSKYSGSSGYSTLSSTSSYRYKPPAFSSTLSSKYRSPSTYSSYATPSTYTSSSLSRNLSSSYLSTRSPRFNSVSSYASAISSSSDWKSSADTTTERLWRSPSVSLSRRNSSSSLVTLSRTPDRTPRPSLPAYTTLASSNTGCRSGTSPSAWSGASADDDRPGIRIGINNIGNTCFMNAVLQCLCHTKPISDYFLSNGYKADVNTRSASHGDLVRVFQDFVTTMWGNNGGMAVSPYELRKEVQRYASRFTGNNQQDAQEFLRYLLQGLHDDVNRVRGKIVQRNTEPARDSASAWRRYLETDNSTILDSFAGQLKSTLRCNVCNNESITYDPFWDLSLPLPEHASSSTLRQCFNLFTSPEILDGHNKPFCELCKKKTLSSKKMEISRFPKILVIHFKRFSTYNGQKLEMMVECPMTLGNVSDLGSSNCLDRSRSYSLYGVVDHMGSFSSGHYIAKCLNRFTREWYEFDDPKVTKVSSKVVTYKAYILFYAQEDF